jgi:phosphosulfolactate synthase
VNLANITPGQVLRLEGFRPGIGRAVDYSIITR